MSKHNFSHPSLQFILDSLSGSGTTSLFKIISDRTTYKVSKLCVSRHSCVASFKLGADAFSHDALRVGDEIHTEDVEADNEDDRGDQAEEPECDKVLGKVGLQDGLVEALRPEQEAPELAPEPAAGGRPVLRWAWRGVRHGVVREDPRIVQRAALPGRELDELELPEFLRGIQGRGGISGQPAGAS